MSGSSFTIKKGLLKNSLLKRHPKGAFSGNSTPKAFIENGGAFGTIKNATMLYAQLHLVI